MLVLLLFLMAGQLPPLMLLLQILLLALLPLVAASCRVLWDTLRATAT
jgi:hypothetical protein